MKKLFALVTLATIIATAILGISKPASAQWTEANGPYSSTIYAFASTGSTLFAGWQKGVYVSTDNGANWTTYNNLLTNLNVVCLAAASDGSGVFAGTGYAGPYFSTDNGQTWIKRFIPTNGGVSSLAVSGNRIFAGLGNGAFVSSDNGVTWDTIGIALPATHVIFYASGPKVLLLSTIGRFLSTDGGTTWGTADTSIPELGNIYFSGSDIFGSLAGKVLRSTDNGTSWAEADSGIGVTRFNSASAITSSGSNLFAGTSAKGVFLSTDNGELWTPINAGLPNNGIPNNLAYTQVYCLTVTDSFLLVGFNQGGIWRLPFSQATASVIPGPQRGNQERFAPYPNPTRSSITLDGLENVNEIRILDATGREMFSQKIADRRAVLNVSNFPAGIYSALLFGTSGLQEFRRFTILH